MLVKERQELEKDQICDDVSFHVQLLMNIIDMNQYPFTKLIIERKLTQTEYSEIFNLLTKLDKTYQLQKEQGLLNFSSLLIHFAGMLNEKLSPTETITALINEGLFVNLMNEFLNIMEQN